MTTIRIEVPDDQMVKLQDMASRLGVSPEELVRVSIDDLLARPDRLFERTADYVLHKNAELYRRLA
jgi:predicted transcriptional regulator